MGLGVVLGHLNFPSFDNDSIQLTQLVLQLKFGLNDTMDN